MLEADKTGIFFRSMLGRRIDVRSPAITIQVNDEMSTSSSMLDSFAGYLRAAIIAVGTEIDGCVAELSGSLSEC
jgi:hypothetical protein